MIPLEPAGSHPPALAESWWLTLDQILALPVARPGDYPAEEWTA